MTSLRSAGAELETEEILERPWFEDLRLAWQVSRIVIIVGESGSGKSLGARWAAHQYGGREPIVVHADLSLELADFLGRRTSSKGEVSFISGPLIRAMEEGRTLLVEEAGLIAKDVLAGAFLPIRRGTTFTNRLDANREIKIADSFRLVMTSMPSNINCLRPTTRESLMALFSGAVIVETPPIRDRDVAAFLKAVAPMAPQRLITESVSAFSDYRQIKSDSSDDLSLNVRSAQHYLLLRLRGATAEQAVKLALVNSWILDEDKKVAAELKAQISTNDEDEGDDADAF